jgi:cell division protein ZapA
LNEDRVAQVNVTINSRQYRMQCEDGQEERLVELAKLLDDRINELRGKFGEVGDTRLTVMAALTMADELHEVAQKIQRLEQELAGAQDARAAASARAQATQAAVVAAFNSAAERLESMAKKLNQTANGSGVALG